MVRRVLKVLVLKGLGMLMVRRGTFSTGTFSTATFSTSTSGTSTSSTLAPGAPAPVSTLCTSSTLSTDSCH